MIRALGFEIQCDRCKGLYHSPQPAPDRAGCRRIAKAAGWGRRWQPRRRVNGTPVRGHFEDICPDCLKGKQ